MFLFLFIDILNKNGKDHFEPTKPCHNFICSKYVDKDHDGKIRETAHYANEVMRPALGLHFVRPVSIGIMLSEAHTDHIRREAQKFRPPERCFKDISGTSVIVSDDSDVRSVTSFVKDI